MIRVLIVDDMETFRERFREILTGDPAIEVVGTASSGEVFPQLLFADRFRIHIDRSSVLHLPVVVSETDGIPDDR
jgi:DNA-binding NarL/FixJ family response regulator